MAEPFNTEVYQSPPELIELVILDWWQVRLHCSVPLRLAREDINKSCFVLNAPVKRLVSVGKAHGLLFAFAVAHRDQETEAGIVLAVKKGLGE